MSTAPAPTNQLTRLQLLRSYKEQGFLLDVKAEENNRLKVAP